MGTDSSTRVDEPACCQSTFVAGSSRLVARFAAVFSARATGNARLTLDPRRAFFLPRTGGTGLRRRDAAVRAMAGVDFPDAGGEAAWPWPFSKKNYAENCPATPFRGHLAHKSWGAPASSSTIRDQLTPCHVKPHLFCKLESRLDNAWLPRARALASSDLQIREILQEDRRYDG